jgi:hypothetical protein
MIPETATIPTASAMMLPPVIIVKIWFDFEVYVQRCFCIGNALSV